MRKGLAEVLLPVPIGAAAVLQWPEPRVQIACGMRYQGFIDLQAVSIDQIAAGNRWLVEQILAGVRHGGSGAKPVSRAEKETLEEVHHLLGRIECHLVLTFVLVQ